MKHSLAICDPQPLIIEGIRSVLRESEDLEIIIATTEIDKLCAHIQRSPTEILLIDKVFCEGSFSPWMQEFSPLTGVIAWGTEISESEALHMLQSGIRGVLRKSATPETLMRCLTTIALGHSWIEDFVLRASVRGHHQHTTLTPREQQVVGLVEQGLSNRDIAGKLGIQPGTVKIHLKHIFEKTGVRGRYGLALTELKRRGLLAIESIPGALVLIP